jgi:hypothetical protein
MARQGSGTFVGGYHTVDVVLITANSGEVPPLQWNANSQSQNKPQVPKNVCESCKNVQKNDDHEGNEARSRVNCVDVKAVVSLFETAAT